MCLFFCSTITTSLVLLLLCTTSVQTIAKNYLKNKKAKMKKIYTFVFVVLITTFKVQAQPGVPAATPPVRNATDYVSLYSGAYTNVDSTDFFPGWGQTTIISEFYVGTDTMIKYSNFNYEGIQLKNGIDVSNMTKLHIDFWSTNCTAFEVSLINTSPAPTVEQAFTVTPTSGGWNSFDIDLSNYTNIALNNVGQIKLVSTPFGGTPGPTVYLDNVYFYKSATTPTITNFTIPSKNLGNAPFIITAPTSNSTGAFTYTSSNPAVATVAGSTITIVGIGNTTIKATQAAAGSYTAGTKSTMFTVNSGLAGAPTTAAPTPTKLPANVISLYSNAYTNVPVDTWSAVWDQADVADVQIVGNDTKKYTNLVYAGVEFTAPTINVTNAQYYHVDVWTPNATSFHVKLVDFGANGTYGGGDDVEFEYTCTPPAFSTWVSYDIPMTAFTGLTTKAHLAQMLFVSSASTVYVDNVFFWSTGVLATNLSQFNVSKKENTSLLNWTTLSETNNAGFGVERSKDAKSWEQIQFVKGNGTTTVAANYSTTDNNPTIGTNYYRLKQIDNNGKFTYSSVQSVYFSEKGTIGFSFYPNPSKNNINVALETITSKAASLELTDNLGRVIKSIAISNQNSNSNISINTANMNKGIYFLVLKDGAFTKSSTVVID
jgi:hypothetical protein